MGARPRPTFCGPDTARSLQQPLLRGLSGLWPEPTDTLVATLLPMASRAQAEPPGNIALVLDRTASR